MAVISLLSKINQALHLQILSTDDMIRKGKAGICCRCRLVVGKATTCTMRFYYYQNCVLGSRSIQHYVIKFVSELRYVCGIPDSSTNKTEILLNVALGTINLILILNWEGSVWFIFIPPLLITFQLAALSLILFYMCKNLYCVELIESIVNSIDRE